MLLRSPEEAELATIAGWLAEPENGRWLRFGPGLPAPSAAVLRVMCRRDTHVVRVFTEEAGGQAVGVVALSDVDREFRTGTLWYVLGEKQARGRGLATRAVSALLGEAFSSGALFAVQAWVVDGNMPSMMVLSHNRFRFVGRQRCCHVVEGCIRDRLLFDLLADEHRVIR
ncbi:MAG: GNAT family protein [Polyangiaceae bacterium]